MPLSPGSLNLFDQLRDDAVRVSPVNFGSGGEDHAMAQHRRCECFYIVWYYIIPAIKRSAGPGCAGEHRRSARAGPGVQIGSFPSRPDQRDYIVGHIGNELHGSNRFNGGCDCRGRR